MKKNFYFLLAVGAMIVASCSPKVTVDRSKVPGPGPAPAIQIGEAKQFQLANGLKVILVENHKLPTVSYNITLDVDPVSEGNKAGYVGMAGELLSAGTKSKSKAQIDEAVDFLGANLSTGPTNVSGSCLVKHSDTFLSLMSDVLMNPTFPEDELEKLRKQSLSGLASSKTDPNTISSNIAAVMNYGTKHPYGELETEESVKRITQADVKGYYDANFKPNAAYLVIVGDITLETAKKQAEQYFGSWKGGTVAPRPYTKPTAPAGNRVGFVAVPGAVQSVIDITYPIDLQPGTQDAIVAGVLNNILGGSGFQARLMQNLREDKAYTYGAYSSISPDEIVGSFSAGASVRNEVTDSSIVQFLYEMERLVKEPVDEAMLQTVKNIMTGSFARSLERPQTVANFALNIEKYKLPKDFYQTYLQKLNAVTPADVQAMAKRVIKPSNANITVVGNKDIADKLAQFAASGKVEFFNPDGTPFQAMKAAPAGMTANDVLKNYIKAIGGEEKLATIKSFEQVGTMALSGMNVTVSQKVKDGKKLNISMTMGPMEVMKQVFDGENGLSYQMGQKQPMEDGDLEEARLQCDLLGELHYAEYGIIPTLLGMESVNGEEAYVIELKHRDGSISTDYFSAKSGLRIKSLSMEGEGEEAMVVESLYSEYGDSNGIKYVKKYTQNVAGQSMEFNFTEFKVNPTLSDKDFVVE